MGSSTCVTYLEIILTLFLELFLAKVEINTSFQVELHDIIIVAHHTNTMGGTTYC